MSSSDTHSVPSRIVVIGGGATGTGIAKLAAERGFAVTLIERGNLGQGTSSHFHGILHSGSRYAVNDPLVAAECFQENQRLRTLIPSAITDTGGLFLALNDAEVLHAKKLVQACLQASIPIKEISVRHALQAEPHVTQSLKKAFTVPDGFIDGVELMRLNRQAALGASIPATILTDHDVIGFDKNNGNITTVVTCNSIGEQITRIPCDYVINAAGVWAGRVTQFAGITLDMVFDKGTMIVFKDQLSTAVLNRCRPEADGDLLASSAGQSIMGTTARVITDPDNCIPTQEEADVLVREGSLLVPALAHSEASRIYAGVRPLLKNGDLEGSTRSISRSYRVIDHSDAAVNNFISVVGGKVTLYRRMSEAAVDMLCAKRDQSSARIR